MDDEFPDPDEEYEMRYAEEFELMNELGEYWKHIDFVKILKQFFL
jgi:hypothetical protein